MNRPCQYAITCPGTDLPFLNASSEALDTLDYLNFGFAYGPGGNIPPMQSDWTITACGVALFHTDSPNAAQLQAIADAIQCNALGRNPDQPLLPGNSQICCQPSPSGDSCFTVDNGVIVGPTVAEADERAKALACYFSRRTPGRTFRLNKLSNGCFNVAYLQDIVPSGGVPPYVVKIVDGTLPPGVVFHQEDPRFGTLDGLPTQIGNFTFTVQVSDIAGNVLLRQDETVGILGITNPTLPAATMGTPYLEQVIGSGGTGPYSFTADAGSLPAGLVLDSSGIISGTPITAADVFFTVTMTDATGSTCQTQCEINVAGTGPDWTMMVWDVANATGGASASITALKDTVTAALAGAEDGSSSAIANLHGSLTYTGPACNCQIVISIYGGTPGHKDLGIRVLQDGNTVYVKTIVTPRTPQTLNFSLGAGTNSLIEVQGGYAGLDPLLAIAFAGPGAGILTLAFQLKNQ